MDQMPKIVQVMPDDRRVHEPRLRPKFISINEAYEYLNCSRSYFYAALYSKVKKRKLGRRTLLELDSIDEVADSLPPVG
jgi:hypothetical protein